MISRLPIIALYTVFGGWFALTVAHQFTPLRRFTRQFDFQGMLLPIWTFFAPFPGTQDSEILVRYFDERGEAEEWKHVKIYEPRRASHALFHFNRRLEKTVFDAVGEIRQLLGQDISKEVVMSSAPYIALLGVVLAVAPVPPHARKLQFMLVQSAGHDRDPRGVQPIIVSGRHSVDQGGA